MTKAARTNRKRRLPRTLAGLEELDLFPSDEARNAAIESYIHLISGWSLTLGLLILVAIGAATTILAHGFIVPTILELLPLTLLTSARNALEFTIVIMALYWSLRSMQRRGARRALRRKLIDFGIPVCMSCGYLLRGWPPPPATDKCPECGKSIEAAVAATMHMDETVDEGASSLIGLELTLNHG